MANKSTQVLDEVEDLKKRLNWLDEERRKAGRRVVALEKTLITWERDLESRELRLLKIEENLAKALPHLTSMSQMDTRLQQLRDELVRLVEQYDQRRLQSQQDFEKLRHVEHEVQQRDIAALRKDMSQIGQFENALKVHQAEEERLGKISNSLQISVTNLMDQLENWKQEVAFLNESEKANASAIAQLRPGITERSKRIESVESRIEVTNHNLTKLQRNVQEILADIADLRLEQKEWSSQLQTGEYKRNKRIGDWEDVLNEHRNQMQRYATEWAKFSSQYNESKDAVSKLEDWQMQQDQRQREAYEVSRLEANQMRSRWDNILLENESRWKNIEVDQDQRRSSEERRAAQVRVQLDELAGLVKQLSQEKDALWRVQNAQADAMKKWPRIWLEEIEKAIAHDPNQRRQPALVPVRED